MKFGQLIDNTGNIFLQNNAENEAERLLRDLFLLFKKALYEIKGSGLHLRFTIF